MQQFHKFITWLYVWLNMFRASPRPSSGAYTCSRSLRFNRWTAAAGAFWTWSSRPRPTTLQPLLSNGKTRGSYCSCKLLMMGKETPETCWATHKRKVINLWKCCILLVELFESYDDARTYERQKEISWKSEWQWKALGRGRGGGLIQTRKKEGYMDVSWLCLFPTKTCVLERPGSRVCKIAWGRNRGWHTEEKSLELRTNFYWPTHVERREGRPSFRIDFCVFVQETY